MTLTLRLLAGTTLALSAGLAQAQVVTTEELETLLQRDQPGATAAERVEPQAAQTVTPQFANPQPGAGVSVPVIPAPAAPAQASPGQSQGGIATTVLPPATPVPESDPIPVEPSDSAAVPESDPIPVPESDPIPVPPSDTATAPAPLPPADGGAIVPPSTTETAAPAPSPQKVLTAAEIDAATYTGGPLPKGRSAVTVKLQILLDRAGISPGVIDGIKGGMSRTALTAFQSVVGLAPTGELDLEAWQILGGDRVGPITTVHTISADEVASLSPSPLPTDYAELAQLDYIGYTSMPELLGELYHMDETFLRSLNPNASWTAGEQITVVEPVVPGEMALNTLAHIVVDKARGRLVALDHDGAVIGDYPVTIGSTGTPSPTGTHKVEAVAMNPTYHYSPDNFVQGENLKPLTLPPGPNGPVGSVWIDLDAPSYGLHGTPRPEKLFVTASHGCVRLTNWDAQELAAMVNARFAVDPGAQIDVTFTGG